MDPSAAGTVTGATRHADLRTLAASPVQRSGSAFGTPTWLITGFDAAREFLAHQRAARAPGAHLANSPHACSYPADLLAGIDQHLLGTNPPEHTRLRRLASGALREQRIERFTARVTAAVDAVLDELAGLTGPTDLVVSFGNRVPLEVMAELLGVPDGDRSAFLRCADVLGNALDHSHDAFVDAATATRARLGELVVARRAAPGDDLLSDLLVARSGEDRLTDDELTSMAYALIVAGHETTVNLVCVGVLALLMHPDQLQLLRDEPSRIDDAVDELLRFDGPLQSIIPSHATESVEIDGVTIPAGEIVLPLVLAANRDPARFAEPDRLDITRDASRHLAFGHGIHRCIGAPIARLSGRVAIGGLLARFPRLRLADPDREPLRRPGPLMNGLVDLPVLLD